MTERCSLLEARKHRAYYTGISMTAQLCAAFYKPKHTHSPEFIGHFDTAVSSSVMIMARIAFTPILIVSARDVRQRRPYLLGIITDKNVSARRMLLPHHRRFLSSRRYD